MPSPFRSPVTICVGRPPTANGVAALNVPSPLPSNTDSVLLEKFDTVRSRMPSPLKSAATIEADSAPTLTFPMTVKPPDP